MVFTQGFDESPFSTAFLASKAAPIITEGFEVFVHDVIDAMTTSPFLIVVLFSLTLMSIGFLLVLSPKYVGNIFSNALLESISEIRSCGRFGPAIDGTTVDRSSSIFSENRGETSGLCHSPWSFAYFSTSSTCSAERPVSVR
ncbi:unannotated protein [freshwater metagenome]|uniref:Unannotated protein n=1 Tax=freshwater metagenome TaxID=449393 RepID=A0A6J6IL25_9ZZZZ